MKNTLSLLLLFACGAMYAQDVIKVKQWNNIKEAVFKKMGKDWTQQFNQQYPQPSEAGVRALTYQFDFTEDDMDHDMWLESNPPQLAVTVNGETIYGLNDGKCVDIILAVREDQRKNKREQ